MAKPMPICKGDGSKSDGDISAISGLMNTGNGIGATHTVWNGESCSLQVSPTKKFSEDQKNLETEIVAYMKNPSKDALKIISAKISRKKITSLNSGPLLKIGNGAGATEIFIDSHTDISDFGKIVNPKNKRIAAFPDFLMDWLTRQTEEVVNSLFSPPNLTIIPPTDFGQNAKIDGSYSDFFDNLQNSFSVENLQSMKQQLGENFSENFTNTNATELVNRRLTTGQTGII